jgi:hypothetical protein
MLSRLAFITFVLMYFRRYVPVGQSTNPGAASGTDCLPYIWRYLIKTCDCGAYVYSYTTVYVLWVSPQPHIAVYPPDLFLYVNLVAKGVQNLFKPLAPQLTVLGVPHFC